MQDKLLYKVQIEAERCSLNVILERFDRSRKSQAFSFTQDVMSTMMNDTQSL